MTFDWVQAVPWGVSGASALVAGLAYRRTVRAQSIEDERRRVEMASNFAVWLETRTEGGQSKVAVVYTNRNAVPMTEITVEVRFHAGVFTTVLAYLLPPTGEPRVHEKLTRDLHDRRETQLGGVNREMFKPEWLNSAWVEKVTFIDGAGNLWRRDDEELMLIATRSALRALHHEPVFLEEDQP